MPALVAGIHVLLLTTAAKTWMAPGHDDKATPKVPSPLQAFYLPSVCSFDTRDCSVFGTNRSEKPAAKAQTNTLP